MGIKNHKIINGKRYNLFGAYPSLVNASTDAKGLRRKGYSSLVRPFNAGYAVWYRKI